MSEVPVTSPGVYHKSSGNNKPPTRIVIHTAECDCVQGAARAVANYFSTSASGGSAHYIVDPAFEEHPASDNTVCWHAPPNANSIGIELAGRAGQTDWKTGNGLATLQRAARRTAQLCADYGIPVKKLTVAQVAAGSKGICGHVDVSQAFHQSDHTDPGSSFPWTLFIQQVNAASGKVPAKPVGDRWLGLHNPPMTGQDVKNVQHALVVAGNRSLKVDGVYGRSTADLIQLFQKNRGIAERGVGPLTWEALRKVVHH